MDGAGSAIIASRCGSGVILFLLGLVVIASGFALVQIEGLPQLPTGTLSRTITYLAHLLVPVACIFAYIAHRRAGPAIKWKYGKYWGAIVVVVVGGMAAAHVIDPQKFGREGPAEGMRYFFPSEARTADGNFIPERALMMDEYCAKCHQDIYNDHLHSAHKFSSFNNPAYLFSIKETRKVALERDGKMNASRWCAGCHDQVPFFSGKFDDPNFDIINDRTAPRRHHLHHLPLDDAREQPDRQRRVHHRGSAALPVRLQRQPRACSG